MCRALRRRRRARRRPRCAPVPPASASSRIPFGRRAGRSGEPRRSRPGGAATTPPRWRRSSSRTPRARVRRVRPVGGATRPREAERAVALAAVRQARVERDRRRSRVNSVTYGAPPQPTKTLPLSRSCALPRKCESTAFGPVGEGLLERNVHPFRVERAAAAHATAAPPAARLRCRRRSRRRRRARAHRAATRTARPFRT